MEEEAPLRRALYPRCGVDGFGEPRVRRVERAGGWELLYTHPAAENAPRVKGLTTTFSLQERPPTSTRVRYAGQRTLNVAGRRVDLLANPGSFTAQWVTDQARYVVIGNGAGALVKKLVRCTP